MKIVVIGGVAAGMSAASKARRVNPEADIIVYEQGKDISYGACGLPYYISGVTPEIDDLYVRSVEDFKEKGIEVKLLHRVTGIKPDDKCIKVLDRRNDKSFEDQYDKLIIATGASPIFPNMPGKDLDNVFKLKTPQDGKKIKEMADDQDIESVTIIGGGHIGLELAETFTIKGKQIRIIEGESHILQSLDKEMAEYVEDYLDQEGVEIIKGAFVKEILGDEKVTGVATDSNTYSTDAVIVAIGVQPNSKIAEDAGIELGIKGAIKINEKMETNIADIYAAGDCAVCYHRVLGKDSYLPLGSTANKQGRTAGENAAGGNATFAGILGSATAKGLEMTIARTGISKKEAKENEIDFESAIITGHDHAGYYPNQQPIKVQLIFDKDSGQLLGAQLVGFEAVAKRTDVFATAIASGMAVGDIAQLDLTYAPPFSSPYDVINIAANVANKKVNS